MKTLLSILVAAVLFTSCGLSNSNKHQTIVEYHYKDGSTSTGYKMMEETYKVSDTLPSSFNDNTCLYTTLVTN